MKCPECAGNNTQKVKVTVLTGTTGGSVTGVGVNTNLDLGIARAKIKTQTSMAAKYTPPPEPILMGKWTMRIFGGLTSVIFIYMWFDSADWGIIFRLVPAGFSVVSILMFLFSFTDTSSTNKNIRNKWQVKKDLYEKGWICLQCGKEWMP